MTTTAHPAHGTPPTEPVAMPAGAGFGPAPLIGQRGFEGAAKAAQAR